MSAMQEVPRPEGSGLHQRIDPKDSRWTHHSREFKESFEKGMFVNFPHVVLCEANNPDAVKTEFGWYCFKTRYGIVIDNTTELEILKLGTAGGRGPLSKSTEIRVDCFGLKKAGEAQYYCEGEIQGSKVAFAPEKGVYDIPAGCPYQPKIGAFGNVLDVIKLPYDSRIEVCGTIHEEVLNAILKKRNRRLLQKQSSSIPMIMWIEELEARLAKDRQTDQDSDQAIEGKLLQEQTCRAQTEQEQQSTNHEELGQHGQHVGPFQNRALQEQAANSASRRRRPDSDATMRTAPTKRARTNVSIPTKTDFSMTTPVSTPRERSQAGVIDERRGSKRWQGPSYQRPPHRIRGPRRSMGPRDNGGSIRAPQNTQRSLHQDNSRLNPFLAAMQVPRRTWREPPRTASLALTTMSETP